MREVSAVFFFTVESLSFLMPLLDLLILQLVANHLLYLLLLLGLQSLNGSHLVFKHGRLLRTGLSRHHGSLVKGRHATLRGVPTSSVGNVRSVVFGLWGDCLTGVVTKSVRHGNVRLV